MEQFVVIGNAGVPPTVARTDLSPPTRLHLLAGDPPLVFAVEGSRLYETTPECFEQLCNDGGASQRAVLDMTGVTNPPSRAHALSAPTAISLNVAQSCNLSCSYCYADEGRFGGRTTMMSQEVAGAAIAQLLEDGRGQRVTVGFIGGEPFLNRKLIYWAVEYAVARAKEVGATVGFSVTTNGTLLNNDDLDLLRSHAFAVSVSLDGGAEVNDRERRGCSGESAFERVVDRLQPLLQVPGRAKVTARATITRRDLRVIKRLEDLFTAGFGEVGVSPLRTSPVVGLALEGEDWPAFLNQMVRAAEADLQCLPHQGQLRFSNLAVALKQLHAGYCKPLPCGSAASYVSVGARGEYFTCHRTVDDPRYVLGSISQGFYLGKREDFLRARHVDLQQPCQSCWARYLCGGGCHAEVLSAGRSGCDYIRGWLEYCLRTYNKVLQNFPAFFETRN